MKKFIRNIVFKIPFMRSLGIRAAQHLRGYAGAATNRFTAGWISDLQTINRQIANDLSAIRSRARDMWKNNPLIRAYRKRLITDVVGPDGFKLQMRITDANGNPDQRANDLIESAWNEWCKKENCTMSGTLNFIQVLWLLIEEYKRDGEFIAREINPSKAENKFGFSLELIEPDLLDHTLNEVRKDVTVIMGIGVDGWKRPVKYFFKAYKPSDEISGFFSSMQAGRGTHIEIGASEIIHLFDPEHSNQFRGISHLAPVMVEMHMLKGADEASVFALRLGASKNIFITNETEEEETGDEQNANGDEIQYASYGEAHYLKPGQRVEQWSPNYPNGEYFPFAKGIFRRMAAALGMSYNAWLSDLEGVNFSSMRSGLLTERDQWIIDQSFIIECFLKPVFTRWLKSALLTRAVPLSPTEFERLNKPEFQGRRWQWVDPYKDVQASKTAIESNISTVTRELRKQGIDFFDFINERKSELKELVEIKKMMDEAGMGDKSNQGPDSNLMNDDDGDAQDDSADTSSDRVIKEVLSVLKKHGNGHFQELIRN